MATTLPHRPSPPPKHRVSSRASAPDPATGDRVGLHGRGMLGARRHPAREATAKRVRASGNRIAARGRGADGPPPPPGAEGLAARRAAAAAVAAAAGVRAAAAVRRLAAEEPEDEEGEDEDDADAGDGEEEGGGRPGGGGAAAAMALLGDVGQLSPQVFLGTRRERAGACATALAHCCANP